MIDIREVLLSDEAGEHAALTTDQVDDALAIAGLLLYGQSHPTTDAALAKTYNELSGCQLMVGVDGDSVVSMLAFRQDPKAGEALIEAFATVERRQGGGIGSDLLEHFELTAANRGIARVSLQATEEAVDFYQRRGYRLAGAGRLQEKQLD